MYFFFNVNGKKIQNFRSSLFEFKIKFVIWHLWPYFLVKLLFINEDIFEPYKSLVERKESYRLCNNFKFWKLVEENYKISLYETLINLNILIILNKNFESASFSRWKPKLIRVWLIGHTLTIHFEKVFMRNWKNCQNI